MDFEDIYKRCFKDVFLYLCGLTGDKNLAEEITQDTFAKALKSIDSYNGDKDIRAWLFTIAKNSYYSYCRKQKRQVEMPGSDMIEDSNVTFVEDLEDRETAMRIYGHIHNLNDPYKEVFMLRVMGELPYERIGQIFGKSSGWARVTFYRAKKEILKFMEGHNE